MPDLSHAARIYLKLRDRARLIDGTGDYANDLTADGAVRLARPTFDLELQREPVVFIALRFGTGDERVADEIDQIQRVAIFDVFGLVPAQCAEPGLAALELLADLERAFERPADPYLFDSDFGGNLVHAALRLTNSAIDASFAESDFEIVGFGVDCRWEHVYGNPSA